MMLRFRLLRAARQLAPLQQGDLLGLSGLYAIVNGVRIALFPRHQLRSAQAKQLIKRGISVLATHELLEGSLLNGIPEAIWTQVRDVMLDQAGALIGGRLVRSNLFDNQLEPPEAIVLIRRSLSAGRPVLALLAGKPEHWTVIVGTTKTRLTLFDSAGHHWIAVRSLSIDAREPAGRHVLMLPNVFALHYAGRPPP